MSAGVAGSAAGWAGWSARSRRLQLLAVFAAALVTRLSTVGNAVTSDEALWLLRTMAFSDALLDGRLSDASASTGELATMPGASTLWLGSWARLAWSLGQGVGIVDGDQRFTTSLSGLWTAQTMVAIATSLLIVLVVALVHRWAGWGAAAVVAVLLVGEPWLTGLGSVLHTDELTALFGVAGLLLLALALELPEPAGIRHPMLAAAAAGALLVQSPLTKLLGAPYGVSAVVMLGFVLWRDRPRPRSRRSRERFERRLRQVGAAVVGALVVVPLAWPALIADPGTQMALLRDSADLASNDQSQFFLGEVTGDPAWYYYVVALPLRLTPWFLAAAVVGIPLAYVDRATRARAVWILIWVAPALWAVIDADKKFDRYGLVVLLPIVVLVGLGLGPPLERALARRPQLRAAPAVVLAGVTLYGVLVAPWGLLYFDPVLGGGRTAEEAVLVGWGEGWERAVEQVRDLEDDDCAGVTVSGVRPTVFGLAPASPYGALSPACAGQPPRGEEATYVIAYVNQVQRLTDEELDAVIGDRDEVGTVEVRGITVATIYR